MSKRLIGYGYTNANGVATLDYDAEGNELQSSGYVGQGVGNVDISASAVIDGSTFVSEPLSVWDTIQHYEGTDDTVWSIPNNNIDITHIENGANFVTTSGNTSNNHLVLMKGATRYFLPYNQDWQIELDYLRNNASNIYIGIDGNATLSELNINLPIGTEAHITYTYSHSNNQITRLVNNSNPTTISCNLNSNNASLMFSDWEKDMDISIKNLKVYYI